MGEQGNGDERGPAFPPPATRVSTGKGCLATLLVVIAALALVLPMLGALIESAWHSEGQEPIVPLVVGGIVVVVVVGSILVWRIWRDPSRR